MDRLIYLDHAATTPLDPRVLEEMAPYLTTSYGNPSTTYTLGRQAADAVQRARATVAKILGCRASEVVFTSGGTESINTAIKGVAFQQKQASAGNHIVTTTVEHHAVLHACQYLERFGFDVAYVGVDSRGRVSAADVEAAVNDRTMLVSVMAANNEIGTVQPIAEIAERVRARAKALRKRIPFHTDAVQAPNSMRVRVDDLGVDLLSLAAHKFGGPKGTGVLYLRRGVPFIAQQDGGGQERQRRAGTEDVAGIVGTAEALRLAQGDVAAESERLRTLSERLRAGILRAVPDTSVNGDADARLATVLSVCFAGADAEEMIDALDRAGVACSAGAACGGTNVEPSHVLLAIGLTLDQAVATLRFSVGRETTEYDIDYVLKVLPPIVAASRATRLVAAS